MPENFPCWFRVMQNRIVLLLFSFVKTKTSGEGVLGWLRVSAAVLPWEGFSSHRSSPSRGVWAEILLFVLLGTTSEQAQYVSRAAPSSCLGILWVNLELCLFCSGEVFGLFQVIFNLSLSQQV